MSGDTLLPLSPDEQKLSLALREIPPSRLRDLMTALVGELADFVAAPGCAEMQADGAPCPSTRRVLRRVPQADDASSRGCAAGCRRAERPSDRVTRGGPTGGGPMDIGIPKETRLREHRVALAPSGVRTLVQKGHRVWVESDAGLAAGHPNAGLPGGGRADRLQPARGASRARALVATVFAPDPQEYEQLQKDQIVFGFWGLPAARPEDFRALAEQRGHGGRASRRSRTSRATRPCARRCPRSRAAWPWSWAAALLLNEFGGKGILLGGVPGRAAGELRGARGGRPGARGRARGARASAPR